MAPCKKCSSAFKVETALALAATFYDLVTQALATVGQPLRSESRVLDFGVGWGRIIRFFPF